jgi:signal transduction histidine kinase
LLGPGAEGQVVGLRPGEAAGCVEAACAPNGCGTGQACLECGAVRSLLECLDTREPASHECRLRTGAEPEGGALDLDVLATFLQIQDTDLVVLCLRDISAEKRREVLERVFFHDVLNTAFEIHAVSRLIGSERVDAETQARLREDLEHLSRQIMEELAGQRQLLEAESGDLETEIVETTADEVLEAVLGMYRHHNSAEGRALQVDAAPDLCLRTDPVVLRRVLGNLVKNALEAVPQGAAVTLRAEDRGDEVAFLVHNPGEIPAPVQVQIFQRSFSTKAGKGRGIGTHSAKLFTERHLGGALDFTSSEAEGTIFTVLLPKSGPSSEAVSA